MYLILETEFLNPEITKLKSTNTKYFSLANILDWIMFRIYMSIYTLSLFLGFSENKMVQLNSKGTHIMKEYQL